MGHMKAQNRVSEAEIEQKLIEDANDPDAWEASITVPLSCAPRPEWYGRTYHKRSGKAEVFRNSITKREDKVGKRSKSDTL